MLVSAAKAVFSPKQSRDNRHHAFSKKPNDQRWQSFLVKFLSFSKGELQDASGRVIERSEFSSIMVFSFIGMFFFRGWSYRFAVGLLDRTITDILVARITQNHESGISKTHFDLIEIHIEQAVTEETADIGVSIWLLITGSTGSWRPKPPFSNRKGFHRADLPGAQPAAESTSNRRVLK